MDDGGRTMAQHQVYNSKEPIRLFKSDFLESFTHISPIVVLAVWLPISLFLMILGILQRSHQVSFIVILLAIITGVFCWTLLEYVLHRFLFHATPRGARAQRIIFLLHGIHHAQPMVKTRLVMPVLVSVPLAVAVYLVFYVIFSLILGIGWWLTPFFGGILFGYLSYDMTHYALHHLKMRWSYFNTLRRTHLHHHTGIPIRGFGVTSPLWDIVFGTRAAS
jgi:sterol desaturase/sphingolipid hydroxylase (fatty acid hydroxylase superfamily)